MLELSIEHGTSTDWKTAANGLGEAYVRALVDAGYEMMSGKRSIS